ncbi:MAG TPA: hypothetical protein VID27_10450 [Blastocatellia bacterium]
MIDSGVEARLVIARMLRSKMIVIVLAHDPGNQKARPYFFVD